MTKDFSTRSNEAELMDDLSAPEAELRQNLRELEVVNKLLGGYALILRALENLSWAEGETTITDIGCGGGDMLRAIAGWAKKENYSVQLTGVDYNPVMTAYATEHSEGYNNIHYLTTDVFDAAVPAADMVMCSLFCHHFEHRMLVLLVQRMVALAKRAVIINDLHRHPFAYYAISVLTGLFSKTYMVKNDARLSVARAFTRADWQQIMADAGIEKYTLKWRWAWRWELVILK